MPRRQPPFGPRHTRALPALWLFTDERVAKEALMRAIARLPRGSGVVFRHYGLEREARAAVREQIAALARRHGLILLEAGERLGRRGNGVHRSSHYSRRVSAAGQRGLVSASAHSMRELAAAHRAGADLVFVSPVFPTRSHPGGRTLGLWGFAALARQARCPVIALGGMNTARFRRLKPLGAYGWAAIDALVSP